RRRSCRRRELSRVAQFRPRQQSGACRPSLGTARLEHLLRPSLPRTLPGACLSRRRFHRRACCLHQADRRGALAGGLSPRRARAIETGAYVLAACQGGLHENGRSTYGHSMVVSPWGEVLAEAGENPQILLADIDLGLSAETRAKIPSLKHGREFEVEIAGAK